MNPDDADDVWAAVAKAASIPRAARCPLPECGQLVSALDGSIKVHFSKPTDHEMCRGSYGQFCAECGGVTKVFDRVKIHLEPNDRCSTYVAERLKAQPATQSK